MRLDRLIALLLILIPGLVAAFGWNLMKTSLIDSLADRHFPLFQFIGGLLLFAVGVFYLAGYIFYKDGKRRYLQPKFLKVYQKKNQKKAE
ncbi:conserved exported hypothetical protein [[Clostridium] ultunense Esp]|uniref:DUF2627 family protein n=1 Tax=Thermicanus aegyptius TaxID=94009 RepID=UPI0002B70918|nr:DUF2627 family protein [Thermicanus aegyptius]CCQ95647.1 conserved exported hypothetical protein [[Clostridium] ultunense Esp]